MLYHVETNDPNVAPIPILAPVPEYIKKLVPVPVIEVDPFDAEIVPNVASS